MRRVVRALFVLALIAVAGFCVFGFMATFEPPGFVGMRVLYGAAFLASLVGAVWVARK